MSSNRSIIASGLCGAYENRYTFEESAFMRLVASIPNFEKIENSTLPNLRHAFAKAVSNDPYAISPAYYGITGRRGLWKFTNGEQNAALLCCLHPNVKNTLIIFPPFAEDDLKILQHFLHYIQGSRLNIQIGRVDINDRDLIYAARNLQGYKASYKREAVLDWKYPIPITDIIALRRDENGKGPAGGRYQPLRQALHSIERKFSTDDPEKSRLTSRMIDFQDPDDIEKVLELAGTWETKTQKKKHPHINQYNVSDFPYFDHLLQMARISELQLCGMFLILDGEPKGFSIWERPVGLKRTANIFASQVAEFNSRPSTANDNNITTPHFTTGLIYKTARAIQQRGGAYMSLGGSETRTQHKFKNDKFPPAIDGITKLITIHLQPTNPTTLSHSFMSSADITTPMANLFSSGNVLVVGNERPTQGPFIRMQPPPDPNAEPK